MRYAGDATDTVLDIPGEQLVDHAAYGVDAAQALRLAFVAVGGEVRNMDGSSVAPEDAESNFVFPSLTTS